MFKLRQTTKNAVLEPKVVVCVYRGLEKPSRCTPLHPFREVDAQEAHGGAEDAGNGVDEDKAVL